MCWVGLRDARRGRDMCSARGESERLRSSAVRGTLRLSLSGRPRYASEMLADARRVAVWLMSASAGQAGRAWPLASASWSLMRDRDGDAPGDRVGTPGDSRPSCASCGGVTSAATPAPAPAPPPAVASGGAKPPSSRGVTMAGGRSIAVAGREEGMEPGSVERRSPTLALPDTGSVRVRRSVRWRELAVGFITDELRRGRLASSAPSTSASQGVPSPRPPPAVCGRAATSTRPAASARGVVCAARPECTCNAPAASGAQPSSLSSAAWTTSTSGGAPVAPVEGLGAARGVSAARLAGVDEWRRGRAPLEPPCPAEGGREEGWLPWPAAPARRSEATAKVDRKPRPTTESSCEVRGRPDAPPPAVERGPPRREAKKLTALDAREMDFMRRSVGVELRRALLEAGSAPPSPPPPLNGVGMSWSA
mmetsp:Transcript_14255/g.38413  ORF Transcript_14255/g.38413 Transcript_14255/m.38413 type:complete len:422 (+) Transcript_14255:2132-3397(+)